MGKITSWNVTPDGFIDMVAPFAKNICGQYGIFASVCIAQAISESAWGRQIIGQYNLFGRKAVHGDPITVIIQTQEYIDGEYVTINDAFKDYQSLSEAIEDYCILLTQDEQYAIVMEHKDNLVDYVLSLATVYATDPNYADTILRIIRDSDLTQYD